MFEFDDLLIAIERQRRAVATMLVFLGLVGAVLVVVLAACGSLPGGDMSADEARATVGVLRATQD